MPSVPTWPLSRKGNFLRRPGSWHSPLRRGPPARSARARRRRPRPRWRRRASTCVRRCSPGRGCASSPSGSSTESSSKSSVKVASGASSVETSAPIASSPSPTTTCELPGRRRLVRRPRRPRRSRPRDGLPPAVIGLREQGDGRAFLDVGDGRVDDPRRVVGGLDVLAGGGELRQHPRLDRVARRVRRRAGVRRRTEQAAVTKATASRPAARAGAGAGVGGVRVEGCGSFGRVWPTRPRECEFVRRRRPSLR